jgi:hypothetical protein
MDAGVASGFLQLATHRVSVEKQQTFPRRRCEQKALRRKRLRRREAVSGVAAPPRCIQHRLRRGALDPTPRHSQRRLTPFFSTLLEEAVAVTF